MSEKIIFNDKGYFNLKFSPSDNTINLFEQNKEINNKNNAFNLKGDDLISFMDQMPRGTKNSYEDDYQPDVYNEPGSFMKIEYNDCIKILSENKYKKSVSNKFSRKKTVIKTEEKIDNNDVINIKSNNNTKNNSLKRVNKNETKAMKENKKIKPAINLAESNDNLTKFKIGCPENKSNYLITKFRANNKLVKNNGLKIKGKEIDIRKIFVTDGNTQKNNKKLNLNFRNESIKNLEQNKINNKIHSGNTSQKNIINNKGVNKKSIKKQNTTLNENEISISLKNNVFKTQIYNCTIIKDKPHSRNDKNNKILVNKDGKYISPTNKSPKHEENNKRNNLSCYSTVMLENNDFKSNSSSHNVTTSFSRVISKGKNKFGVKKQKLSKNKNNYKTSNSNSKDKKIISIQKIYPKISNKNYQNHKKEK